MIVFSFITFFLSLALIFVWQLILEPLGLPALPIGGLMVLPLVYFSWRHTLLFVLSLTLVWESSFPLPFGWVAVPLTVAVLLFQVLGRHQLRASAGALILTGVVLQSIVMLSFGFFYPPKTIAGAVLQTWQTGWLLLWAAVFSLVWIFLISQLAKKRFNLDLERRLKDL